MSSVSSNVIAVPSFAKINLSLRVHGRRADGYHEIRTLLQTVTLHDTLTFEELDAPRLEVFCGDPAIPTDERNLVHKAATLLMRAYDARKGARIALEKRIPGGGGLGGGSSNAAVTLLALARLWSVPSNISELTRLASQLGADVPFFLYGGTALGTGTGATITPLDDAEILHLIIVTPRLEVSTAAAYTALNAPPGFLTNNEPVSILSGSRPTAESNSLRLDDWHNDFESVVFRLYPQTRIARDRLLQCGARTAMLSGSGASVFGIFEKADQSLVERELRRTSDWRIFSCRTLARKEYEARLGFRQAAATKVECSRQSE